MQKAESIANSDHLSSVSSLQDNIKFKIPKANISSLKFGSKVTVPNPKLQNDVKPCSNNGHKYYSETEVIIVIKAVVKELAGILVKSGLNPPNATQTLSQMGMFNLNTLLAMQNLMQAQSAPSISQNVIKSQDMISQYMSMNPSQTILNSITNGYGIQNSLFGDQNLNNVQTEMPVLVGENSQTQNNAALNANFELPSFKIPTCEPSTLVSQGSDYMANAASKMK